MKLLFLVISLSILVFIFIAMAGGDDYIHYSGTTEVTGEEYAIVASENVLLRAYNQIAIIEDGLGRYAFTYDFYVDEGEYEYTYLATTGKSFADRPMVYSVLRTFKTVFDTTSGWVLLGMVLLTIPFVYIMTKKPRKVFKYIEKLKQYLQSKRYRNIPDVAGNVIRDIADYKMGAISGIICVRSWGVDRTGHLRSIGVHYKWDDKDILAHKPPDKDDMSGVHGYRLGAYPSMLDKVMGIVELSGKYEYHPDGVVRAEHCQILILFMSKGYDRLGRYISDQYKVPVYFADNPMNGYLGWLYSSDGFDALQHNYDLLEEGGN